MNKSVVGATPGRGLLRAGAGSLCLLGILSLLGAMGLLGGCKSLILAKGYPNYRGEVTGLPVHAPVRIVRDSSGIPHIYAQDRHDLMVAQGFVHAQDRLWQMETLRRVATGTLAEAAALLESWDRQLRADSRGAAVYEVFLTELVRALLEDEVDGNLFYYFHVMFSKYLIQDVILDRPESGLWDRKDTPQKEGPREIVQRALAASIDLLESRLGKSRRGWSWGGLHPVEWRHAGATSGFTRMLLNSGPYPVGGDATTLNAQGAIPAKGEYRSVHLPALRMVVPLNDPDGMQILVTTGQSGQPGHRHYDDMVRPWLEGKLIGLPTSAGRVEAISASELLLIP